MASYSKRMMEESAKWIACNKHDDLSIVHIPDLRKDKRAAEDAEEDRKILRLEKAAQLEPGAALLMMPKLAKVRELVTERERRNKEIYDLEAQIENTMNSRSVTAQVHDKSERILNDTGMVRLSRWFLAWGRSGHNVFDLSADFTAAMLLTNPRELDISEVRLPFPGLLMMIPEGFAVGADGRSYTKIHVTEISALDRARLDVASDVMDILKGVPESEHTGLIARAHAGIDKDIEAFNSADVGALRMASATITRPGSKSSLITPPTPSGVLHIYATDGTNALSTTIERDGLSWDSFDEIPNLVDDDADRQASQTLRRIVFGALAYATVVERALEPRTTEPRKRGAGGSAQSPKHWDIGRTIRLDQRLVRAARSGSREIALRLKHRHIVIGHYRNQAHGIRFSERKRIYIECFWKGPADGAELVHTYKLEEPDESRRSSGDRPQRVQVAPSPSQPSESLKG